MDQENVTWEELSFVNLEVVRIVASATKIIYHPKTIFNIQYKDDTVFVELKSPTGSIDNYTLQIRANEKDLTYHIEYGSNSFTLTNKDIDYPVQYVHELKKLKSQHLSNKERGILNW